MNFKKIFISGLLISCLWMGPPLQAAPSPVEPPSVRVIESEPVTASIIVEEEVIEYEEHLVYTTTRVNAREYPTINSESLYVIPKNTQVMRTSEEINGWDCVIVNEQELFVKHEYLMPVPSLKSIGTYELTAYCACNYCCGKSDGITASGTKATQGQTIACNFLPFGTRVVINDHVYIVEDRGGQVTLGNEVIDIYFDSHEEAKIFGRQTAEVYVECGDLAN